MGLSQFVVLNNQPEINIVYQGNNQTYSSLNIFELPTQSGMSVENGHNVSRGAWGQCRCFLTFQPTPHKLHLNKEKTFYFSGKGVSSDQILQRNSVASFLFALCFCKFYSFNSAVLLHNKDTKVSRSVEALAYVSVRSGTSIMGIVNCLCTLTWEKSQRKPNRFEWPRNMNVSVIISDSLTLIAGFIFHLDVKRVAESFQKVIFFTPNVSWMFICLHESPFTRRTGFYKLVKALTTFSSWFTHDITIFVSSLCPILNGLRYLWAPLVWENTRFFSNQI